MTAAERRLPESIAVALSVPERLLLFCLASGTDWQKAGITHATAQQNVGSQSNRSRTSGHAIRIDRTGARYVGCDAGGKMRRGTAIHEAGHAIVIWALGLTVGTIEIGIDGDDTRGKADLSAAHKHLPTIDRIAICYADTEAQHVFDCPTHEKA